MIHHIDSPWQLQWCRLGNIGVCFICYSVLRCGVVALLAGCAAVSQLFWLCLGNPPTHHIPTPNPFCRSVRLSLHPSVVCFSLTEQNHDCNVQHKQNMSRTTGPPDSLFPSIMDSLQLFFLTFLCLKIVWFLYGDCFRNHVTSSVCLLQKRCWVATAVMTAATRITHKKAEICLCESLPLMHVPLSREVITDISTW